MTLRYQMLRSTLSAMGRLEQKYKKASLPDTFGYTSTQKNKPYRVQKTVVYTIWAFVKNFPLIVQ